MIRSDPLFDDFEIKCDYPSITIFKMLKSCENIDKSEKQNKKDTKINNSHDYGLCGCERGINANDAVVYHIYQNPFQ